MLGYLPNQIDYLNNGLTNLPLPFDGFNCCVEGEVEIDPQTAIANGVILRASLGQKIVIGKGVAIANGVVIHAHQGDIIIEDGAVIGSRTLIMGNCVIGCGVVIGTVCTIWNQSIAEYTVIKSGSLVSGLTIEDQPSTAIDDRLIEEKSPELTATNILETSDNNSTSTSLIATDNEDQIIEESIKPSLVKDDDLNPHNDILEEIFEEVPALKINNIESETENITPEPVEEENTNPPTTNPIADPPPPPSSPPPEAQISISLAAPIYGQESLQKLLATLFPHRQQPPEKTE